MRLQPLYLYIIISFLLLILDFFSFLSIAKQPSEKVIIPIKSTVYDADRTLKNTGSILINFSSLKTLDSQRKELVKENEELKLKEALLEEENKKLRDQLGAPLPFSYRFLPARVIGLSKYLEISSGSNEGIKEGMTVVDGTSFIGKVISVSASRSSVLLSTDSEMSIPARTSRGVKGVVTGQNGKSIILNKVLQKDALFLSDQVFSSGEGGFPPNLLIGIVSHIESDDASVYKQARVRELIPREFGSTVFVITNSE